MIAVFTLAAIFCAQTSSPSQLEAFSPLPTSLRDVEDRLILRFKIGYEPIFASLSGEPDPQANPVADDTLRATSVFLDSNLAFGTRGIGLESLNTYFLGTSRVDLEGAAELRPVASTDIVYRYNRAREFAFHQIYAELDGFTREGALSHVFLRAGRQTHYDEIGIAFDGATLGYRDERLEIMLRGGRRAAIFNRTQDDPGLVFGGDVGYDFGSLSLLGEFTYFRRDFALFPRDQLIEGGNETVTLSSAIAEASASWDIRRNLTAYARLSFVSPEISHLRLDAEWLLGPVELLLDFDQKIGKDLFFDVAGSTGFTNDRDVQVTYETFRLNIPDRAPYSDIELSALIPVLDWLELDLSPRARVVYGDPATRSPFDATYVSAEAGAHGRFILAEGHGLEADASYAAYVYFRGEDVAGTFRDDDMGGEKLIHEASAGVRYTHGGRFVRRRLLGDQTVSAGVSAYLRSALIDSRLIDSVGDSVYGGVVDLKWYFTDFTRIEVAYEYARDSQLFVPELGDFHHVRAALEARF